MTIKKLFCIPALLSCSLTILTARNIFLTPADSSSTQISTYTSDPLAFASTVTGPTGAVQVLPSLSANKFYAVGRSAGDTLTVLEGAFPNLVATRRIGLNGGATSASLSGDGRRLAVLTSIPNGPNSAGVHVLDTTTDQLVTTGGPLLISGAPIAIAMGIDQNRVYALGARQLIAIEVGQGFIVGTANIPTQATGLTVGPNGLIYVTAQDVIHEIDPITFTIRNTTPSRGFPARLSFTPDGRSAFAVNLSPGNGVAAYYYNAVTRKTTELTGSAIAFDKIVAINNTTALAFSTAAGRVYSLSALPSGDTVAFNAPVPIANGATIIEGIRDLTVSAEGTVTRFAILATASGLFRYEIPTGTVTGPVAAPFAGNLSFTTPASNSAISQVFLYNTTQSVGPGQTTIPLVIRALDSTGNPIAGAIVRFDASAAGLGSTPSGPTNLQGYSQVYYTVPAGFNAVTVTVTPTVGSFVSPNTFTISIATTGGGGGGGGGTSQSGNLTIILGQGQVIPANFSTAQQESLTIRLRDAAGNPVAGAPITWTVQSGQGNVNPAVSTTDSNGVASADFLGSSFTVGAAFIQSIVQATTGVETVNFFVTTLPSPLGTGGLNTTLNAFLNKPTSRVISQRAGEVVTNAVEVITVTTLGIPIPNVGLRVAPSDLTQGAQASCVGIYILTDERGVASCDLVATGSGTGPINAVIGSQTRYPLTLTVLPGGASRINITGGNNQSGAPGQQLAGTLTATLTDSAGTPVSGTTVVFEPVVPGTATLRNQVLTSDAQGVVSAQVTLGTATGPVQIRVRTADGSASAVFALSVVTSASTLVAVSGDTQTALAGQAFAAPLQVRVVDASNNPVVGTGVTFAVTSGSAVLGSTTATTNAQGVATTNVTAGSTAGPVVITASAGSLSARFNLSVRQPGPIFTAASVVNGASFQPGISPGSIATIFASGIAPALRGTTTPGSIVNPLPTRLAEVEVLFNGINAPIYAVSNINGQESVTVQVPFEVGAGAASVVVRTANGGSTTVDNVQVSSVSPGVFETTDGVNSRRYAAAYRGDGSAVSSTNPARRGDLIRIFATGLGQTTPATGTNRIGAAGQTVAAPVVVGLNNAGVRLVSAEYLPGSVGIYLVTFEVPADVATSVASPLGFIVTGPNGQEAYAASSAIPIQ